jgi:hypothetical protein
MFVEYVFKIIPQKTISFQAKNIFSSMGNLYHSNRNSLDKTFLLYSYLPHPHEWNLKNVQYSCGF